MTDAPSFNNPDFIQSYLMGYAVAGGIAGGLGFAYFMDGRSSSSLVKHALVGGAAGYAFKYINANILGTPGKSQGPVPHRKVPMTIAGGISGYAVSYLVGARFGLEA